MTELIPVIHMVTEEQVFKNVALCDYAAINRIFLINHHVSETTLLKAVGEVKERYPNMWVGVNLLGTPLEKAITMPLASDGLWCDQTYPLEFMARRTYTGELFTGVAFKYQRQPENLQEACDVAKRVTDVVVTSGEGTGKETPIDKVLKMREYLGDFPLAVASGVNATNISQYKDVVNYILVASSITDSEELIIPNKLAELQNKLD